MYYQLARISERITVMIILFSGEKLENGAYLFNPTHYLVIGHHDDYGPTISRISLSN